MIPIDPGEGGYPASANSPVSGRNSANFISAENPQTLSPLAIEQHASVDTHPANCIDPSSGKERPPQDDKALLERRMVAGAPRLG
jgi:hypothetical protein